MQIPSFMIPPGSGPGTPKSVDRRRRMAEAMMMEGTSGAPVGHWTQVGARLANALSGGYQMRKADQAESEGMARSRELLAKALQGGDSSSLMEAMNDPYQSQAGLSMLGTKWDQANQPPPDPMEQQMKQLQMQKLQAEVGQIGQQKPTALMQEYEWAKQNGFVGSPLEFINAKKASTNVTVNTGEIPDGELRKKLDGEQAKVWGEYLAAGAVSGSNAQDFTVLDELIKIAPQGPVTGRLAQAFPGVSSAGDAFQSIVKRIAPTLRAPGSGSTSDIEYDGMLKSLPALGNTPQANQMILSIMKAKADVNIKRAEVIQKYQTGELDAASARQQIGALDRVSIVSPEMKQALSGISPATPEGEYTIEEVP